LQSTVEEPKSASRGGTYKYFVRGQHEAASSDDYKVEHVRKQQLKPYDTFLKKFQYHDALNAALEVRSAACFKSVLQLRH
jgi:U3 small nucleolar RNA-associated protein 15